MDQTIRLDAKKRESSFCEEKIYPLRRGERNNVVLTIQVRADGAPYDLTGKEARLVGTTADGKLVGPCPMEVAEAGIARIMLPSALYSAVGAFSGYVEIREGETLVDTTDSFCGKVIECADLDAEQAEEFTPLLGELQNAVAEEAKRVEAEKARVQAETERATGFAEAKQASQAATEAANDAAADANLAAGTASDAAESANTAAGKATNAAAKAESDVRTFVDAASTAIGDAIAGARKDVDAAVKRSDAATAKAETAVKTADAANTAAAKAATDAKVAIAEVKATEAKLYPAAENILVGSETGAVAHVDDAFAGASLREITVEGACKQDGTPSPDNPVPIQVVENPTFKVTGRNLLHYTDYAGIYNGKVGVKLDRPRKISPLVFNGEDAHADAKYNAWSCGHIFATEPLPAGTYYVSFNLWSDTGAGAVSRYITSSDYVIINNLGNAKASGSGYTQSSPYRVVNSAFTVADGERLVVSVDVNDIDTSVGSVLHLTGATVCATRPTAYAPYVGTSTSFTLPPEHPYLAKLPDGTADEIVVDEEGNVELVARVARIKVPDGGFTWEIQEQRGGFSLGMTNRIPGFGDIKKKLYAAALMSERFESQTTWKNNPCFGVSEVLWVVPKTNQSDITSEDVAAVANGMVFYAPLATPVTYQLGKIEMLKAQDSIINAWTDAEVAPNTSISYVRDVNIVVANLESAIASITEG